MSRREPTPACASTLCSLGASGSGARTRLPGSSSVSAASAGSSTRCRTRRRAPARTPRSPRPEPRAADDAAAGPSKFGGSAKRRAAALVAAIAAIAAAPVAPVAPPAALAGSAALPSSPPPPASPPSSPLRRSSRRRRPRPPRRAPDRAGSPPPIVAGRLRLRRARRDARSRRAAADRPACDAAAAPPSRPRGRRGAVGISGRGDGQRGIGGSIHACGSRASASAGGGRPGVRARHRPRARQTREIACDSPSVPMRRPARSARRRRLPGRQLLERGQAEVVEELARRRQQRRPAGRFAIADRLDPAAILELLDDRARDRDAANVLDVAARHRLAVGDDRQRFEHRARIASAAARGRDGRGSAPSPAAALVAPPARHRDQLDRAAACTRPRARSSSVRSVSLPTSPANSALHVAQRHGLARADERGLEDALGIQGLHVVVNSSAASRRGGRRVRGTRRVWQGAPAAVACTLGCGHVSMVSPSGPAGAVGAARAVRIEREWPIVAIAAAGRGRAQIALGRDEVSQA